MFGIFMLMAGACFALDFLIFTGAGFLPGVLMATGAAAAAGASDDVITNLKNALSGFDLTDPNTQNAVRDIVGENNQNSQVVDKLDELINAYKNSQSKPPETSNKPWYHSLLTDKENTSEDKNELQRLGFNRYVRNLHAMHLKVASPETETLMNKLRIELYEMNGLQTTNQPAEGGYTVPTPMFNLLVDQLRDSGLFMSELTQIRLNRRYAVAPTLMASGHPAPSFKAESTSATAKKYAVGNIVFGTMEFRVKDNGIIIPWTREMDFDSIADIGALINSFTQEWFNILGDTYLFRGNGETGNNKITGLYELVPSMNTNLTAGTGFNSIVLDDFITGDGKLRSVDKIGIKRYLSPSVHAEIKKQKDATGRYILDSTERLAGTIEGKPVVETDSAYAMSESGANKAVVINANLKKGYLALLNGIDIEVAQSNVAVFNDGTRDINAFQENITAIRLNMPFDIQHPFVARYNAIVTKP
jgi:HK97 family phage major capsid protein